MIDCLLCNCLPIYWGTSDVKHYFDPSGILYCESFEEICDTIATLSPDDYQSRLAAIQRNRELAIGYSNAERIIFGTLSKPEHPGSTAFTAYRLPFRLPQKLGFRFVNRLNTPTIAFIATTGTPPASVCPLIGSRGNTRAAFRAAHGHASAVAHER